MNKKIIILCIILLSIMGCDKFKPNIYPDNTKNKKGWYFGFNFKINW